MLRLGTYPPPNLCVAVTDESQSELQPIRYDDTKDIESKFASDERSPRCMRRDFRGPNRDNGVEATSTYAVDHACTAHPASRSQTKLAKK